MRMVEGLLEVLYRFANLQLSRLGVPDCLRLPDEGILRAPDLRIRLIRVRGAIRAKDPPQPLPSPQASHCRAATLARACPSLSFFCSKSSNP
eukprot:CAMPEP_0206215100 /NCGR_PEP_ID=MMETSP0047_2-20121206/2014_1 /ASSEMBLY_ACC=CAM_ASM_000192 /TAXON_ID=195065 /ORGANISM="Chroomonas mesostigmatica_cf, Strain CCMP1168" /LENGTH=91 /DNA_ID=CAMNT_0053637371 /DNA_START=81 /DNA_END=353 /DNA_ORIENTATION=+